MDYKELTLFDFESRKKSFNYPPQKEAMMKKIWQEDELAFINWMVGLLL